MMNNRLMKINGIVLVSLREFQKLFFFFQITFRMKTLRIEKVLLLAHRIVNIRLFVYIHCCSKTSGYNNRFNCGVYICLDACTYVLSRNSLNPIQIELT